MSGIELVVIFVSGIATGVLGAMLGIGGGVFIIPILVIGLGVPVHTAIAASIVAVIATSSAAASVYLGSRLTNIRFGMTLETTTTAGGILGGLTAVILGSQALMFLFGAALTVTAVAMWRRPQEVGVKEVQDEGYLGSSYYDPYLRRLVRYRVSRLPLGLGISLLAGMFSGLLGIGGGVIQVPAMALGMAVPIKAATASSDFMIGVTAVASAYIYYAHGNLDILVTAPTAMGVFLGSLAGAHWGPKMYSGNLANIFAIVLIVLAIEMILRALAIL